MYKVSFVILHYMDIDTTIKCIKSIEKIDYLEKYIVIVDNCSTNGSGKVLKEKYKNTDRITVICMNENKGFAQGNNAGYNYAKNKIKSDFIIVSNNDVFFESPEFVNELIKIWKEKKFYMAGPDIITPSGKHQNPHREKIMSTGQVRKMITIKTVFLWYFYIKKVLKIDEKVNFLENLYEKRDNANIKQYLDEKTSVVLQGACIIFAPQYIQFEDEAFDPETFMYGEEDLLALKCIKKGYGILYTPQLQVLHLNGEATKQTYKKSLDKNIFTYKYMIKGFKILLKRMTEDV